ncbi:hypothetical protein JKJ07_46095 [Actinoplanes sp. LDG1-01]|uniref:Uncharacterized protein n=2 Tax=Paractinoplanes lichenicola TaxID=2802976 RepID=A0ABS1W4L4_9ACTN|nr:hypothetical protein [Actinoplanes lichenicola]
MALAAACGGDSGDTNGDGANSGGQNGAFTAYTDCLKSNGVTITMPSGGPREGGRPSGAPGGFPSAMPRPSGSAGPGGRGFPGGGMFGKPDDVDDATWQKAQEACSSLRPSGRPGGRGNGQNAAYQNCLEENGVTDPSKLDTTDATAKKAIETCKVLQPTTAPSA